MLALRRPRVQSAVDINSANQPVIRNAKLNKNHPLAMGLRTLIFFGNGVPTNLVTGKPVTGSGDPTRYNHAVDLDGTDDRFYSDQGAVTAASGITVASRINPDLISGSFYILNAHRSADNLGVIFWQPDDRLRLNWGASTNVSVSSTIFTAGNWYDVAGMIPASGNPANARIYNNGVSQSLTPSGATDTVDALTGQVDIGGRDTGLRDYNGQMEYIAFWDRELTEKEYLEFRLNPKQVLEPVFSSTIGTFVSTVNNAFLTDTTKAWTVDEWIGFTVRNTTDGSSAVITDNDATTITGTLSGGTNNYWSTGDSYEIVMNVDTNDQIVYETTTTLGGTVTAMSTKGVPTITGASGSHSFDVKYRDATDSKVSSTVTVTVTV